MLHPDGGLQGVFLHKFPRVHFYKAGERNSHCSRYQRLIQPLLIYAVSEILGGMAIFIRSALILQESVLYVLLAPN